MKRVLIVSNRLPLTLTHEKGVLGVKSSVGGLATGMRGVHQESGGLWIGWPGASLNGDDARKRELETRLAEMRLVPVHLSPADVAGFYTGYSNGVLWPLLHSMVDRVPLLMRDWPAYVRVNERYADEIAARHQPGDLVWIHDYHLMLVPDLLRRRVPEARVGFFLHIPFPSSSVFRVLPQRESLLRGLLGADLIGFHTASYVRNFAESLLRILSVALDVDRVAHEDREVRIGSFPMGIDAAAYATLAGDSEIRAEARGVRGHEDCSVLLGIDRLDYTKGIPRRLLAFEHLLVKWPEMRERVLFVQVAVPSRASVAEYQKSRGQLDALVGRINGAFATPRWSPVRYLHRALHQREVVALYCAADVMVVTPIRDGMNLVAKEFAAARTDEDGVLVLSEFAGASSELAEALHVNPYDIDGTAAALHRALVMPPTERGARMRALRERVLLHDVDRWRKDFMDALAACEGPRPLALEMSSGAEIGAALERALRAPDLLMILDYDGTLVPFAPTPEEARPDPELVELLHRLAARPRTAVHLVSGRSRDSLEQWLGDLSIGLHAEHGLWSRPRGGTRWIRSHLPELPLSDRIATILDDFAARTPGARVERKASVLAWHWRQADPEFGMRQACELRLYLTELLSNVGAEVISGDMVIEVRPYGVHKGTVVEKLLASAPANGLCLAMGDDRTDEDLFAALPADAISIHVGPRRSAARLRLQSQAEARTFLRSLVEPAPANAGQRRGRARR